MVLVPLLEKVVERHVVLLLRHVVLLKGTRQVECGRIRLVAVFIRIVAADRHTSISEKVVESRL